MQYLYIIQCQDFHKIGIANDVDVRLAQLSTGNPYPLEVLAVYGFKNAEVVERSLHQRYTDVRVRGEWFGLDDHALSDIRMMCQMLGGEQILYGGIASEDEIEEAEDMQEFQSVGAKFDYKQMFLDGWRIEPTQSDGVNGKYWAWRKQENGKRLYIYGGRIADLPYPMHSMKEKFTVDGIDFEIAPRVVAEAKK